MTLDEIKDYIKDYFLKNGYQTFEDDSVHTKYLDVAAIRYQYFGEYMFDVYKDNLNHCLFHNHKWFLLEMINPKIAMMTTDTHTATKGVLDDIDTKLWNVTYKYYDHIGHDRFTGLDKWLDKHRDELLSCQYDIV